MVNNLSANAGDTEDAGLIPGSGRSPGGGNGNPLQYSCQDNPMERGSWWTTVHGVTKELDTTEHTRACVYIKDGERDGLEIQVAS